MRNRMFLHGVLIIGMLVILCASQAGPVSAGIDAWTNIGPEGGSVISLAVDPVTPTTVYAGTYLGGVFKSINGGASWSPANTGLGNFYVGTLLIDPVTPSNVYALTRGGLYKSTNRGGNWTLLDTTDIFFNVFRSVAMDPKTPTTLYGSGGISAVYKSTDGGLTWNPSATGLPGDGVLLAVDPHTPTTVYAVGYANNVYKSTNSGGTWSRVDNGDLAHAGNVLRLAVDPKTPGTLYIVANTVYKSTDGGVTWKTANGGLSSALYDLVIDPQTPSTLYVAGNGYLGGVYRSTDRGENWVPVNTGLDGTTDIPHTFARSLAINPLTTSTLYVGLWSHDSSSLFGVVGGGVYKTTNSGESWSRANTGLFNTNILALAGDPTNPAILYGGTYPGGVYITTDGGADWKQNVVGLLGTADVTAIVIDPLTPTTFYMGIGYAGVYKTTDSGETWTAMNTGLSSTYGPANIVDLAIDPLHPNILYAGAMGTVYKTIDGGESWNVVSTDLSSSLVVEVLAIDPKTPTTLYLGGFNAGVYKTIDGGQHWTPVNDGLSEPVGPPIVYSLAVDPLTPTTVYAGTSDSGVYKTTDGGGHWTPVNTGLPGDDLDNIYANTLAINPQTPSTLYVGLGSGPNSQTYPILEGGVFQSLDGGEHWSMLGTGLTDFFINDLEISPADPTLLFAAADGGSIYAIQTVVAPPAAFGKTGPGNGASGVSVRPTLSWGVSSGTAHYEYCIDTGPTCGVPWVDAGAGTHAILTGLSANTTYYWQVRAVNSLGMTYANGSASAPWSFTTGSGSGEIYLPLIVRGP